MRFRMLIALAAILAATATVRAPYARAAALSDRAALAGRQKIREELAAAIVDGHINRMDQYRILLHAKEVLRPQDMEGLERTLDRLAISDADAAARRHKQSAGHTTTRVVGEAEQASFAADKASYPTEKASYAAEEIAPGKPTKSSELPTHSLNLDSETTTKPSTHGTVVEETPPDMVQTSPACNDGCCEPGCGPDCGPLGMGLLGGGLLRGGMCGPCDEEGGACCEQIVNLDLSAGVAGFKGPIDIGNANGNFGAQMGINGAIPIAQRLGIGLQAGTSEVLSNLKGIPYPLPQAKIRNQNFTTVGMFQRIPAGEGSFQWGFVHDWLFDEYYSSLRFAQWRVKAALELNPWNEVGLWAAIRDHGSTGELATPFGTTFVELRPFDQGNFYWTHYFAHEASLTGRLGMADNPGGVVFGADGRVPVTPQFALTGTFSYVQPRVGGGPLGQTQEAWNVGVGVEFVPGGFGHGLCKRFAPFIPVADNGSLSVREVP